MARVPRYMHLPMQVLWFDTEDIALIIVGYVVAMVIASWPVYPAVVLLLYAFMKVKATQPRGFLRHLLYHHGFGSMAGYPPPSIRRFRE